MRTFRFALTGDFLDESDAVAQGNAGLPLLEQVPHLESFFIMEHPPADTTHRDRLYSQEVSADQTGRSLWVSPSLHSTTCSVSRILSASIAGSPRKRTESSVRLNSPS